MTHDYQSLCKSLLRCVDTGNKEAEEAVLCQIRVALRHDEMCVMDAATDGQPTH
jgi:hypothetical protein